MAHTFFSRMVLAVTLLFTVALAANAYPRHERRCGGDGPHPLVDISPTFETATTVLPLQGDVSDFTLLEAKDAIAFRGVSGALGLFNLFTSNTLALPSIDFPLSRVVDTDNRYLLAKDTGALFDFQSAQGWQIFSHKQLTHLFWNAGILYSLESDKAAGPGANYIVHQFSPKTGTTTASCVVGLPATSNISLAEGHHYPYLFFMSNRKLLGGGYKVSFFKMNVDTCQSEEFVYHDPFPGPAERLVRFEPMDATMVKVNHATKTILWDFGERCNYFDTGDADIIPLRDDLGVIALWSKTQGLNLAYLTKEKRARILEKLPVTDVSAEDLVLGPNASTLFYRPSLGDQGSHSLLRVDLITKVLGQP